MPFEKGNQQARKHDLSGKQFGKWTVVGLVKEDSKWSKWLCRCACGVERPIPAYNLLLGKSRQCTKCAGKELSLRLGKAPKPSRLEEYGITREAYKQAKKQNLKWCHFHKTFEPKENFNNPHSSNRCRIPESEQQKTGPRSRFSSRRFQILFNRYRITESEYNEKLARQENTCAVCGKPSEGGYAVDHNHKCCPGRRSCGKCLRGLLCMPCNQRLGHLEDVGWLERAAQYLKNYEKENLR